MFFHRSAKVLTAAALQCLNGEILARLVVAKPEDEERCRAMGITDPKRVYTSADLAPGQNIIFAATGVTDGALLRGVRFFGEGIRTHTLVMTTVPHHVRFIDTIHAKDDPDRPGKHGVFDGGDEEALATIDEAYELAKAGGPRVRKRQEGDRTVYEANLGRRIGYLGGREGERLRHPDQILPKAQQVLGRAH